MTLGSASDCISMAFLSLKSWNPTRWHLIILRGREEDVNSLRVTSVLLLTDTGRPLNLSFTKVQSCSSGCPLVIGLVILCTRGLAFSHGRHSWLRPLGVCVCVFHITVSSECQKGRRGSSFFKLPPVIKAFQPSAVCRGVGQSDSIV